MSSNHLKTAREWGQQQALEQAGYKNVEELRKEAADLGLIEQPKTAAAGALENLFRK